MGFSKEAVERWLFPCSTCTRHAALLAGEPFFWKQRFPLVLVTGRYGPRGLLLINGSRSSHWEGQTYIILYLYATTFNWCPACNGLISSDIISYQFIICYQDFDKPLQIVKPLISQQILVVWLLRLDVLQSPSRIWCRRPLPAFQPTSRKSTW